MRTRRHVLQGLAGLAATPMFLRGMAAEAATANDTILVAIVLTGGNDGLNTVVPLTQYGTYAQLRTPARPPPGLALAFSEADLASLAFNANSATPASQSTQFAFAPSMTAMRALYGTGHLAVIAGVGLPPAEINALSHYDARLDWLTGQINIDGQAPAGWLNLALNGAAAGALGPTAAFDATSQLTAGTSGAGLVLSSPLENYGLFYATSDKYYNLVQRFNHVLAMPSATPGAAFGRGVANQAVDAIQDVKSIASRVPAADYPTPVTPLDANLRDIARMIIGGAGIRGYTAIHDGYDTHASQALVQPGLVAQLGTAMSNFYAYLQAKNAASNVVVMTISDFGRRPAANLDFGTDHGGGGVSFVLGERVCGGVYGNYPSLTKLDANANLAMTVDFRNVISDMVQAMGGNAAAILGANYPRLGFI